MKRRNFVRAMLALPGGAVLLACASANGQEPGRLRARPRRPSNALAAGRHPLADAGPGAFLYVPAGPVPANGLPLVLLLHGATRALPQIQPFIDEAERRKFVFAVPFAREHTWDLMSGGYGPDVRMLDAALTRIFDSVAIRRDRVALGGFSDGASYALSIGLQNGDLFTHLIAFSPGYIGPGAEVGSPAVFISHGTQDRILPISATSRRIVPQLEARGVRLKYQEFEGGHGVPEAMRTAALDWFTA